MFDVPEGVILGGYPARALFGYVTGPFRQWQLDVRPEGWEPTVPVDAPTPPVRVEPAILD